MTENKPRNLAEVIDAMVLHIPKSETDTLAALASIRSSVLYAAPEMMQTWWREIQVVLQEEIGTPDVDWKIHVAAHFSNISFEQMKKHLEANK